jgi:NAD-dependent SIR2 family protein deacetylase
MSRTVYVLGAGSSRAATMSLQFPTPLATDFFKESYLSNYWSELEFDCSFRKSSLYFILARYFESINHLGQSQGVDAINIEEIYSFLYSFDRVFKRSSHRLNDFEIARKQILNYIIRVIRYSTWRIPVSSFLKNLIESIEEDDSIITFNWDTLIEQAIEKSNNQIAKSILNEMGLQTELMIGFKQMKWEDRFNLLHKGKLLKVHGSITFTSCVNSQCRRHEIPYIWELNEETPEFWPCISCGAPTEVMILSPHGAKTYTTGSFFRLQANLAAEKLSMASGIVIIGYSIPIFDIEARSMFRCCRLDDDDSDTLLKEVVVIDPRISDEKYVNELKNLMGIDNKMAHGHKVEMTLFKSVDDFFINN